MTVYIGVDQHARSVRLAAMDSEGQRLKEHTIGASRDQLMAFVNRFAPDVEVAVEAMGSHYWLVDALEEAGITTYLAHPLMLKAITYAKVKTDKADALTIAKLLRLGMLPLAYMYPRGQRPVRDLSRRRQAFVNDRAHTYRHIQALHQQAALPTPSRNAVKRIPKEALVERFEAAATKLYAGALVDMGGSLTKQIKKMEEHLHKYCRSKPAYFKLMQIPGVGKTYGQIILLESEGIERFPSYREYVSYSRLVPGSDNSGSRVRSGHNPNQGNGKLKNAYRQAAVHAVMFDRTIKHFFDRKLRVVHRKNIAYAIVARKIAIGAYYVMRDNVAFDLKKLFGESPLKREVAATARE